MKELKKAQMGIIAVLALMLISIKRRLPEARRLSSGITTTLALAGIVLLVAAGTVSADTEITEAMLPYTTTTDGERYFLTTNLSMPTGECGAAITIGSIGVTIDGEGHSITGSRGSCDCGISVIPAAGGTAQTLPAEHLGVLNMQYNDSVIQNLEIEGFCTGIALRGTAVNNNTVIGCNIHECGDPAKVTHGIHLVGVNYCTITKNEVHDIEGSGLGGCGNGGNGIFLHGQSPEPATAGDYNNITCNYLHNNAKSGFFMKYMCKRCNISYNNATHNVQSGIMPKCEQSNYNTMEYNNMSYNGEDGLFCGGNNNIVRYNTALNNGIAGIHFKAATGVDNTVEHNFACGHATDIIADASNSIDKNTCNTSSFAGWCDWNCDNKVSAYFDYDEDGQYSMAACPCTNPAGGKCACCNPGLFNGSDDAKASYEASCDCQWTAGDDPNDCNNTIQGEPKPKQPDLIVANKSEAWFNETHYNVSYRVQNIGNDTSNISVACVSVDGTLQTAANKTIGELAPNAYSPVMTVGPFGPCGSPSDTIKVCADCDDNNTEWNEGNNCLKNEWFANQPDLTITEKHETWIDEVAGTYNITYTICNIGTATAVASKTKVTIDGDSNPAPVPELAPTECLTLTLSGPYTVDGDYDDIELCADGPKKIPESDETNNCIENRWYKVNLMISVDPASLNITPQDQFDINITVDPAGLEIYGVEYYLTYNTSVLRAESQVKGPFLGTSSETIVVVNDIDRGAGIVSYAETRKIDGGAPGKNISSVIQFTAIGKASECTDLHLYGDIIVNTSGGQVSAILEDGRVCLTNNLPPVAEGCSKHLHNNAQKKFECLAQLCSNSTDPDVGDPDAGGEIVYIRWSFGDGEYGTSEGLGDCPCKNHSYTSWIWEPFGDPDGDYVPFNASLTVTDNGDPQLEDTTYFNVSVYLAGDANADGTVNILDAVLIGLSWDDTCTGTDCCQNLWTGNDQADRADLNNDCKVNILDAVIVGTMWNHNAYYPV